MTDRRIILYDNSSSGERMKKMHRDGYGLEIVLLASGVWLCFSYWLMAEAIKAWQHPTISLVWTTLVTVAAIVTNGVTLAVLLFLAFSVSLAVWRGACYAAGLCRVPFRFVFNCFRRG